MMIMEVVCFLVLWGDWVCVVGYDVDIFIVGLSVFVLVFYGNRIVCVL